MANERGKGIDKTHLSVDNAEERGFIHRDYIAHSFRWTHAAKLAYRLFNKGLKVVDIGCGKEVPFAKMLYSSKLSPEGYIGFDVNKLEVPEMLKKAAESGKFPMELRSEDFAEATSLSFEPNLLVCFEVLEHVEPAHARAMLKNMHKLLAADGVVTLSTPCWDPHVGAAANHVSEILYDVFGWLLEDCGFEITGHWGTFASQRDYKDLVEKDYPGLLKRLGEYYDSNVLATILAPMYPDHSRNCVWDLKKASASYVRKFKLPAEGPWSSSEKWKEFNP